MKEVVYISWVPLTEKVERDWYVSYLINNGVVVAYWDVTGLLFPEVVSQASLERECLTKINNYRQFESLLAAKDVERTNFVMLVNYEGRFNRLYQLLTIYNCKLFFFEWGNFPIKNRKFFGIMLGKLLRNPRRLAASLSNKLRSSFAKRMRLVKPFDVVFAVGASSIGSHLEAGRLVAVNLFDYDNYLLAQKSDKILPDTKYAVFLDINLAFQSDLKVVGWDCVDAQQYGNSLNRFFHMVEERFGVEVVIAAHPKANYDSAYFQGRKTIRGVTPELVKDADFIITHHSTSISYAVLNSKPLLFIYTNEMKNIYSDTIVLWIHDFAEYLGQPAVNIDELTDATQITITESDPVRYDLYKYNYLTSKESEGRLNCDIVLAELTA